MKYTETEFGENKGIKAKSLIKLKEGGFLVPDFFVLSNLVYHEIVDFNHRKSDIGRALRKLTNEKILKESISKRIIDEISLELTTIVSEFVIPNHIIADITNKIDNNMKYAVRSSGTKEDLERLSFAGQYHTFLNVSGTSDLLKSILACYCSMYEKENLAYVIDHKMSLEDLDMAVIIQEMVDSELSGIGFTINPLTGNDKEIVVEVAKGQGECIVSGKVIPETYRYQWYDNKYDFDQSNQLLQEDKLKSLMEQLLRIQVLFGHPCDIEFAMKASNIYILQARPITKILYSGLSDWWTTANFKDGGVAATVCKPYMWSLYEYVWEIILKKFLLDTKLMKESNLRKLGAMYYGRPYWNLSVVKEVMAKIPGYKEKDFDSELGVTITYEGDGKSTKLSLSSILGVLPIALAQKKITKRQMDKVENYKDGLLRKYESYVEKYDDSLEHIEDVWYQLIKKDYLESESTYFWQIFINTVQLPLFRRSLPNCVSSGDFLDLIGGMKDISHLKPYLDLWRISRTIRDDETSFCFWEKEEISKIKLCYESNSSEYGMDELRRHVNQFGYHSERELDVSYPCYSEEIETVIQLLKDTIMLEDSRNPRIENDKQYSNYLLQLEVIKKKVPAHNYKKLLLKIENMRKMLWWREELKDISIRFYYIVRIYTMCLAKEYCRTGILKEADDIWYLKIKDLFDFVEHKKDKAELHQIIEKNKIYDDSFQNFKNENEIGKASHNDWLESSKSYSSSTCNKLMGIGCNNGMVTGIARVIENVKDMDRLKDGDILVTKYTDTGWTSRLAVLKGIVTECGGVLCHASIISREYGIPSIVNCSNVTKIVKDGSKITMNGETGEVMIHRD